MYFRIETILYNHIQKFTKNMFFSYFKQVYISLESFVERKCMLWIWKLLNLDNDNPVRSITTSRMNNFKHEIESIIPRCMVSPLRQIFNIHSYGLTGDLVALLNNPLIIPYSSWKYKVSQTIMCHERESWRA